MRILLTIPMMLLSGCENGSPALARKPEPSGAALCQGTAQASDDHAEALVADGGPRSTVTGQRLLSILDAGCRE